MLETKKSVWSRVCYALLAILFLAAGILFIKHPIATEAFAGYIYICFFTATGIMQIITYFTNRKSGASGWLLALGIIDVILGIYFLCNVLAMITLMPFIIGFWAIITGFMRCVMALQAKGDSPSWGWDLATGGLMIVIGIIMICNMFVAIMSIAMLLSIAMFVLAVQNIVKTFTI